MATYILATAEIWYHVCYTLQYTVARFYYITIPPHKVTWYLRNITWCPTLPPTSVSLVQGQQPSSADCCWLQQVRLFPSAQQLGKWHLVVFTFLLLWRNYGGGEDVTWAVNSTMHESRIEVALNDTSTCMWYVSYPLHTYTTHILYSQPTIIQWDIC